MWSARKMLVIIVCFLPCHSSVKGVVKDLPSVGPTISEGILPILAVGFEDVQRHSRTVTAAALSTMSISMLADRDRGIIRYLAQSGRTGGTIMALYGRHPASLGWEPKPKSGKTGDARGHAGRANRSGHLCCGCGRPIRAGDPHWAGHGHQNPWHYACAEQAGLTWSWACRPAEPPIPAAEMD